MIANQYLYEQRCNEEIQEIIDFLKHSVKFYANRGGEDLRDRVMHTYNRYPASVANKVIRNWLEAKCTYLTIGLSQITTDEPMWVPLTAVISVKIHAIEYLKVIGHRTRDNIADEISEKKHQKIINEIENQYVPTPAEKAVLTKLDQIKDEVERSRRWFW